MNQNTWVKDQLAKLGAGMRVTDLARVEGERTGTMVALAVPAEVAMLLEVQGSDTVSALSAAEMHVTMAYLDGWEVMDRDPDVMNNLAVATQRWASMTSAPNMRIGGFGVFTDPHDSTMGTAVALIDSPDVMMAREWLMEALRGANLAHLVSATHGFIPHVTLATGPVEELMRLTPPARVPWTCQEAVLASGDDWRTVAMADGRLFRSAPGRGEGVVVAKEDAPRRIIIAPLYVPDAVDTHGDMADERVLEDMVESYLARGQMAIWLQHMPGVQAGQCVGIMAWPYEVECELRTGDGKVTKTVLPPGTVYQAVRWEPWAWDLVRTGHLNALSLGGRAFSAPVEEPDDDDDDADDYEE
mgnify:FL=1